MITHIHFYSSTLLDICTDHLMYRIFHNFFFKLSRLVLRKSFFSFDQALQVPLTSAAKIQTPLSLLISVPAVAFL